ncbi:hypothetical protein LTR60_001505, partial [Cryomyces antarcticus]
MLFTRQDQMIRGVRYPCSHHAPIDPSNDFRLISICQGSMNNPLELVVRRVHKPWTRVNYTPLSYCWGDLHDTKRAILNHVYRYPQEEEEKPGVCFRHSFSIIKRLYAALLWLRSQ